MVNIMRRKETHLGLKVEHKRKTGFLKIIVKNNMTRRPLPSRVKNKHK